MHNLPRQLYTRSLIYATIGNEARMGEDWSIVVLKG